jgi:hypothetical protein
MKEHPMLFGDEMVRAILDGRKTQTRRIAKGNLAKSDARPYAVGDRIWVRECFTGAKGESTKILYRADGDIANVTWTPSIHMPRWASRIDLKINSVWMEPLQAISESDARAEGIIDGGCLNCGESEPCNCPNPKPSAVDSFVRLWDSIYGNKLVYTWNTNPLVWVIEFTETVN